MTGFPPPDKPYDLPTLTFAENVHVHIVGYIEAEQDVEILARDETRFFRFCLPKHARAVRDFWRGIGVTNVLKLQEGAYESREGIGPYKLSGMAVGEDVPVAEPIPEGADPEEAEVVSVGSIVLMGVKLEG